MEHRTEVRANTEGRYYPHCSCRRIPYTTHLLRWQADDILIDHLKTVDRARASLRRGRGTLLGEYEHAVKMAADPNVDTQERLVWKILADGYASRIGKPAEQEALF